MGTDPCIDIIAQAIETTHRYRPAALPDYAENIHNALERRVCDCGQFFANQQAHRTHVYQEIARAIRSQIARELELSLPTTLANEAEGPYGWLSDGHECVSVEEPDRVDYCGEGSIDLHHIASIAAASVTNRS